MKWNLDTENLYIWRIEETPFGVEKIDRAYYVPFRLWGKERIYVTRDGEVLAFSSRREAMKYTEEKARDYLASAIRAVTA